MDIRDAVPADDRPLETHYADAKLSVVNNGHTVQVNYPPGSWANIAGKRYELLQFHLHGPSENTVNGEAMAMETHLVHNAEDGSLAVLGVLMKEGADSATPKGPGGKKGKVADSYLGKARGFGKALEEEE